MAEFNDELVRKVSRRLSEAKIRLLYNTPFYGNLIMHLKFAMAKCQTAATNMKKILFDPTFVDSISDKELDFVLMHEVLHCVLQHCIRGKNKNQYFFNVACDIVVNSNIMQTWGISEFTVAGNLAMHTVPSGEEGYKFSAEEVYDMLMDKYDAHTKDVEESRRELENNYGVNLDRHDIWQNIPLNGFVSDEWKQHLKDVAANVGINGLPSGARKLLDDFTRESSLNWEEILHDFIKIVNDKYDFSFAPPDRRVSTGDFILPSFLEEHTDKVENIWFVVDSSGSVSVEMLSAVIWEIRSAMNQFEYLSGKISFFDTQVTEPVEFDSIDKLNKVKPEGGGGTDFFSIFKYMNVHMENDLPVAIIILTDGYAVYPPKEYALGVPVLWLIFNNNKEAPWGTSIIIKNL